MRIAILTSSYPRFPGDGTAPFIKSLAENYAKLGNSVFVVAPYDPFVKGDNDIENVQVIRFRYIWPDSLSVMGHARSLKGDAKLSILSYLLLPLFLMAGIICLARVCLEEQINVIHANWVLPNGPIALFISWLLKIPYVLSLHGSDIYISQKNLAFSWVAKQVLIRASFVTACSQALKDSAIRLGASLDKTLLLPWGADPAKFSPDFFSSDLRAKFGVFDSDILVVAIGRLVYKKGFDVLISAWERIFRRFPTARLIIGGEGPLRNTLFDQAKVLGIESTISFPGKINWQEMPNYLASADIFVLPSVNDKYGNVDGLPTVLLEAMSSGTVCVASDIGGVSLVVNHWQNGVLVHEKSVSELVESLEKLIIDGRLRKQLGSRARASVEIKYNWFNVARKMEDLFVKSIRQNSFLQRPKRLGVLYRRKYIELYLLNKPALNTDYVLDVGCFDGNSITFLNIKNHIAIDLSPEPAFPGIRYVKADGCNLPFMNNCFSTVFALDVIEHIENDRQFAKQLKESLAPGGRLILTTPSRSIKLYPNYLTNWISHKWGHNLRLGYSREQLLEYFAGIGFTVEVHPWNAKQYRFWYLVARFLLSVFPKQVAEWVEQMAEKDYQDQESDNGFWIVEVNKE